MRKGLVLVLITTWWLGIALNISAQSNTQQPIPLIQLLERVSTEHNITFSYSVRLVTGLQITPPTSYADLAGTLSYISEQLPLNFQEADTGNYSIVPVRVPLQFKVADANDQAPIELVYVTVNRKKQVYLIPQNGTYQLSNSFPTDSLEIRTSFYNPILTTAGAITRNNGLVLLSQDTVNLGEVTVMSYLTSGVNSFMGDHHLEVDMNQLGLIAGETDGDIFQVLQAIPGIRSPNGKPGSLNFRGSPFSQNLTLFDNIPIYHTGHFFGTFSPYNPGMIDRMAVYRGVLPSRYGGRVGGLIEVQTSDQVPDSTTVGVVLNTVMGGIEVKARVTPKVALFVSGRSSFSTDPLVPKLRAFRDLNFQGSNISQRQLNNPRLSLEELDIDFSDVNARLVYDIGSKHKLFASYLNIDNKLFYEVDEQGVRNNVTHSNSLTNEGYNFAWRGLWSERFTSNFSFTHSDFKIFEDRQRMRDNNGDRRDIITNAIDDTRFTARFDFKANANTRFDFGYEFTQHDVVFEEDQDGPDAIEIDPRNGNAQIHSFHGSIEKQYFEKLIINAGLHVDLFSITDQQFFDPRVSLTYLANKSLFLKASGGRSHQYIRQSFSEDFDDFRIGNQFWVLTNREQQVVEGRQFMIGALYDKGDWLLDLEIYTNKIQNINRPGLIDPQGRQPDLLGDLETVGADFLVKKRWTAFETWLSYTWANTEELFNEREGSSAAYFDQRHVMNVKWLYPRDRWSIALSWNLMSGLPVRLPDEDEIEDPMGPDPDEIRVPYDGRFPVQHQMDLSATYQFSNPDAGWKGIIGLSILNLYDRQNIINVFQENVFVGDEIRYGVGFAPNLQLKFIF